MSLSAPVNRGREASRTTLYPYLQRDDAEAERWLREEWEIPDRGELLYRLDDLLREGYRAPLRAQTGADPAAWDVALYVDVVRKGYAAGHLDAPTAWQLLRATVMPTVAAYDSWQAFATDYLLCAKCGWGGSARHPGRGLPRPEAVPRPPPHLLDPANPASPWQPGHPGT